MTGFTENNLVSPEETQFYAGTRDALVVIAVTYQKEWPDGYGARGWKLDSSLDDPAVIATTAETGCQIDTSVLIHDMLDHYISGFPLSGHRNEAMALIQLGSRTNSSPQPDYEQMVDEDIINGMVNGEPLRSFLPNELVHLLPIELLNPKEAIAVLEKHLGTEKLRAQLIDNFFNIGKRGITLAQANWKRLGLDYNRRTEMGHCLQKLLVWGDNLVQEHNYSRATAEFMLNNRFCQLTINSPKKHVYKELINGNDYSDSW